MRNQAEIDRMDRQKSIGYAAQVAGALVLVAAGAVGPNWVRIVAGVTAALYLLAPLFRRWDLADEARAVALAALVVGALSAGGLVFALLGVAAILAFAGNLMRKRADIRLFWLLR